MRVVFQPLVLPHRAISHCSVTDKVDAQPDHYPVHWHSLFRYTPLCYLSILELFISNYVTSVSTVSYT